MRRVAPIVLAAAAAFLVCAEGGAHADEADPREESRAAFRRGVAAIEQNDWKTARTELERAYELFAHPSILLDLGLARARTEAWVPAETALVKFLADDAGAAADEVETARRTLVEVKSHLGTLHLRVIPDKASVTVDGDRVTLDQTGNADVRVVIGEHTVRAESPPAFVAQELAVTVGTEGADRSISLPPFETRMPYPLARKVVAISLIGAGLASVAVGVFAGVRALDLAHQYDTVGEPRYQDPAAKSAGITWRTVADVTLFGGAALVLGGVLAYVLWPRPSAVPLALGPGGIGVRF